MSFNNANIANVSSINHTDNWKSMRNERDRQKIVALMRQQQQQRVDNALLAFTQHLKDHGLQAL